MHRLVGRFTRWLAALAVRHRRLPVAGASTATAPEPRARAMLARIRDPEVDEFAPSYTREGGHVRLRGVDGPLRPGFASSHESRLRFPPAPVHHPAAPSHADPNANDLLP